MATESDPRDKRASMHEDQRRSILAGFASLSPLFLLDTDRRGEYVRDALKFRGIEWPYGGELSMLSRREAGFVLEALNNSARPVRNG
jgi:hypothetical protein